MEIVGKLRNCGIISNLLICEFLKICWNIFGNFIVENELYCIIEIVGIIGKFWNFGIIVIPIILMIHMNERN